MQASLADIARRAGVGIGTLYRHFPGRDDLLVAVAADDLDQMLEMAEQALGAADPWAALAEFCMALTEQGSRRRLIRELVIVHDTADSEFFIALDRLVLRASATGRLRTGVTTADLVLVMVAMARVVEVTAEADPGQWRRMLTLCLDGFRSDTVRTALPGPSLSLEQLAPGMQRYSQRVIQASNLRRNPPEEVPGPSPHS